MRQEDRLIINAYGELQKIDGAADSDKFSAVTHTNVNKFLTLVKTRTNFNFSPEGHTFSAIRNMFTSMVGDKRNEIIASIDIFDEFKDVFGHERARRINWLWETFNDFIQDLPFYKDDIQEIRQGRPLINGELISEHQANMIYADALEKRNKYWVDVYVRVYGASAVTPYIHRFANHIADAYRRWGDLYLLNGEGFECSHKVARIRYEYSNNKKRGKGKVGQFLKPLLLKSLRCAYFEKTLNYTYNSKGEKIQHQLYENDFLGGRNNTEIIDENDVEEELNEEGIIQNEEIIEANEDDLDNSF
jgi:hypothetical protein